MRNFTIKNALRLASFDLKINRKQILGWFIAIFAIMFLYMILFPSVKDMAQIKMDSMPKGVLELFGMEDLTSMSNYISYFGMIYGIVLVAISFFSVTFSANLLGREEKTKTIEFLYSLEVSRTEIYIAKLFTAFVANILLVFAVAIAAFVCGIISGGETFDLIDLTQTIKITSFTVFFFMSVGLAIAASSNKFGSAATGSMVVIASYLLGYLGTLLQESAAWLKRLSPFEQFSPDNALAFEHDMLVSLGIYLVLFIAFIVVGLLIYRRRDFNV
jgi:putative exporter of polyketide antibiotics